MAAIWSPLCGWHQASCLTEWRSPRQRAAGSTAEFAEDDVSWTVRMDCAHRIRGCQRVFRENKNVAVHLTRLRSGHRYGSRSPDHDITGLAWPIAGRLFGAFVGLVTTAMTAMILFRGLWMLALPFISVRLPFDRVLDALVNSWRRWRGYPPPEEPVPGFRSTHLPWPCRYGSHIGFVLGAAYTAFAIRPA